MNTTNAQGGWIIPAGAVVAEKRIPSFSVVGDGTRFCDGTKFGNRVVFGSGTKVGDESTVGACASFGFEASFGNGTTFGDGTKFGNWIEFGNWTTFGDRSTFGDGTTFGNWTTFGDRSTFGDGTTFGNDTSFGNETTFGKDTTYRGFPFRKIATMSNIDGTGRQIVCVIGEDRCMIEAGCFWGTLNKFVAKARSEGKLFYANGVSSFCKAMLKTLKENEQEK